MARWWAIFLAVGSAGAEVVREPFLMHSRGGIANTFARLEAGQPVTVGYLGASVTNGAGASKPENNWRNLTFAWLQAQYPAVKLTQIHAVSGGTGAQLGAARVGREYLAHDPHLVFVEFAVNDAGQPYNTCVDTMEGIVRQILRHDPTTDIVFVYALNQGTLKDYQAGRCPRAVAAHEAVAEHYGIPSVNFGWRSAQELLAGRWAWADFSKDSVHPTDAGYRLYADLVIEGLKTWPRQAAVAPHPLPDPLSATNWERARLVPLAECALSDGRRALEPEILKRHGDRYPGIRLADQPGQWVRLRFRGRDVGLYDIIGPDSGQIEVILDARPLGKLIPRWDRHCTYYRAAQGMIARDLPEGEHTIELRISDQKQPESQGTAMRIADLIVNGEPLK